MKNYVKCDCLRFLRILSMFVIMFTLLVNTAVVNASGSGNKGVSSTSSKDTLTTNVYTALQSDTFETEEGGYLAGEELFVDSGGGKDVNENKFKLLTNREQNRFVSQLALSCNEQVALAEGTSTTVTKFSYDGSESETKGPDDAKGVTDETVESWWKTLQNKEGIGSKFLNTVLQDTKPDFVTASKWYKPFSGPISTALGFLSIAIMGLIGIVMGCDIFYITIPPVRLFVEDKGGEGKIETSKFFSHAAIHAVKTVEEGSGDGANKQALGIYFKSRVFELILLAISLLYLVNGQLWTLVGYILDLLSGITG